MVVRGAPRSLPGASGRSGQGLTEYVILTLFVVIGLMIVLIEFEEVLIRLYQNAASLIFSTFP